MANELNSENFESWSKAALSSLKTNNIDELNKYLSEGSLEGIEYKNIKFDASEDITLETWPANRILARYIFNGLVGDEHHEDGINYVVTVTPTIVGKDQKLIQLLQDKKATLFGDHILIDLLAILDSFQYNVEDISAFIDKVIQRDNVHLLLNGAEIHNAGGTVAQELAFSLHLMLRFISPFMAANRKICLLAACDSQYFMQIAKFRALRYITESLFLNFNFDLKNFLILATSSLRELSIYDSHTNMLRITSGVSSSLLGGADVLIPSCFDSLEQVYALKEPSKKSLRQSRNVFHVLQEEASFSRVKDPAFGSKSIAHLTREFVDQTYSTMLRLGEHEDLNYVTEMISEEVRLVGLKRSGQIHNREKTICGVNNYANRDERISSTFNSKQIDKYKSVSSLFPLRRDFEDFEFLRLKLEEQQFSDKKILVLFFGKESKLTHRISFVRNYFEILGLDVEVKKAEENVSWDESEYLGLVYCAEDESYDELFELVDEVFEKPKFIAGNKIEKNMCTNIYAGQDIFKTLTLFATELGVK